MEQRKPSRKDETDVVRLLRKLLSAAKRVHPGCNCYGKPRCECGRGALYEAIAEADRWLQDNGLKRKRRGVGNALQEPPGSRGVDAQEARA